MVNVLFQYCTEAKQCWSDLLDMRLVPPVLNVDMMWIDVFFSLNTDNSTRISLVTAVFSVYGCGGVGVLVGNDIKCSHNFRTGMSYHVPFKRRLAMNSLTGVHTFFYLIQKVWHMAKNFQSHSFWFFHVRITKSSRSFYRGFNIRIGRTMKQMFYIYNLKIPPVIWDYAKLYLQKIYIKNKNKNKTINALECNFHSNQSNIAENAS